MSQTAEIEGEAPGGVALLLIDLINDLDFEDAGPMRDAFPGVVDAALRLRDDAGRLDTPVIYVNDNAGQWHSDRERIVERCLEDGRPGRDLVARVRPRRQDYFVIKPQFSGFYATNLPVLLPKLKATRLILAGVAADICVLFTAADAHMRQYDLWVPADAVASNNPDHTRWALQIMQKSMGAHIRPTSELTLEDWVRRPA
jgi:nicotinamidase-related amidase